MVFLYFLARPDWRKGCGFPDFFPEGNRSGLGSHWCKQVPTSEYSNIALYGSRLFFR